MLVTPWLEALPCNNDGRERGGASPEVADAGCAAGIDLACRPTPKCSSRLGRTPSAPPQRS